MSIEQPTDRELRELFGIAEPPRIKGPYSPDPIQLSEAHIEALLTRHFGNPSDPGERNFVARQLNEVAEYFLNDVAIQSGATPAESVEQLRRIQSAAKRLRSALGWDGDSTETIPYDPIHTWLRQAAEHYRDRVKLPKDVSPYEVPWNYWQSWKLTASISGIKLLELWAQEACALVTRTSETTRRGARRKHTLVVAVHRLGLCWMHAYGTPPGRGFDADVGKPTGPFIRFAREWFACMKESVSEQQLTDFPSLKALLRPSDETIRAYLNIFLRRLPKEQRRTTRKTRP